MRGDGLVGNIPSHERLSQNRTIRGIGEIVERFLSAIFYSCFVVGGVILARNQSVYEHFFYQEQR